jgi:hypothetical protein
MMERKASGGSIRSRRNSYSQPLNVTSSPSPLAQPNSSRSMLALKNGALRKYQLTSWAHSRVLSRSESAQSSPYSWYIIRSEDLDSKTMSLHDSAGKRIWSKVSLSAPGSDYAWFILIHSEIRRDRFRRRRLSTRFSTQTIYRVARYIHL